MKKIDLKKYDRTLIVIIIILTLFGLLMILSSSYIMAGIKRDNSFLFFLKQILWTLAGSLVMYLTAFKIHYSYFKKYALIFYFVIFVALVMVLFVGPVWNGARRWFDLGFFAFQPSEFAKIAMVILMADFISRKQDALSTSKPFIGAMIYIVPIFLTIAFEPDFGTSFLIVLLCLAMLLCSNIKISKAGFAAVIVVIVAAVLIEIFRKDYRVGRSTGYLSGIFNMDSVLTSSDAMMYQLKLSLYALGSGGFLGKGPGDSDMKLMYLPEAHTDFIYPIIGEEYGFVGAAIVILLFVYIFFRGMKISGNAPDVFSKFLALGITLMITFEAMINIGVSLGVLPTKGSVLPFISSGGTSLLMNMAAAGILINLSQYSKRE
ncbi:MAG: putative lipid II flippase FtsW [Elusimicrobiota bacterium]|jgi:cell division protein FtsW|nr:putative lipid II flippase FtsW [Elusimicrobiota bacterium]